VWFGMSLPQPQRDMLCSVTGLRKMGATDSSETCVPVYQTSQRHAPQESIFKELAVRMRDFCRHSESCQVKDFSY